MSELVEGLGLKKVINASGKMTILGVSKVSDEVAKTMTDAGQSFFVMEELMEKSGAYLAEQLQTEDVQIVSSASAGISQSVAALIGKGSLAHLHRPYDTQLTNKRDIIVPKGHNVDYGGTPIELLIAQGGGVIREAGYANVCTVDHITQQITDHTVAILYVKSHHAVQKSVLSVEEAVAVAKKHDLPLIVDAAAEEDLFYYTQAGADLVIYSGAKAFEGPSSGVVIGKKTYIEWVRLQSKGIGRAMKVGKENILGLVTAISNYLSIGSESGASMKKRLEPFIAALNELPHMKADIVCDAAGRDIYRGRLQVEAPLDATMIIREQQKGNPAIYTRDYQANNGIIEYDIRSVNQAEMIAIIERLKEILTGLK